MSLRVVIAGAGLAAQRCAETLRGAGHDGPITMLGAEPHPPYDRPPLSKGVLANGAADVLLRPPEWYAEHGVTLRVGVPVARLDAGRTRVQLDDAEPIPYESLLIATGAAPVVPRLLAGLANVHALRTLDDAQALRAAIAPGSRLAVLGAGLIGQEVAATASAAGARVTLLDAAERPFDALAGPSVGPWLAELHRDAGVDVRLGVRVTGVEGLGRADALVLDDERRIACDAVLVGVGVRPATAWLAGSGLDPAGVPVDAVGHTGLPGVFAAGDAACPLDPHTGRHVSAGHWEAAARQAVAAARAMLGLPTRPAPVPVVWSDQHGIRLQRLGDPRDADAATLDGDPAERSFTVVYHRAGRPVAATLVNRPGDLPAIRRRLSAAVEPEELAA